MENMMNDSCLCCLKMPSNTSLKASFIQFGKPKTYAEILKECFGLVINLKIGGICKVCIVKLRDASEFKLQVMMCQKNLKQNVDFLDLGVDISKKIKEDPDRDEDRPKLENLEVIQSADCQGENDMKNRLVPIEIKKEKNSLVLTKCRILPNITENLGVIQSADSQGEINMKNKLVPIEIKKEKSSHVLTKRKIRSNIIGSKTKKDKIQNLKSRAQYLNAKVKIEANIVNIMKYTSCTPFSNKTLSGYLCFYCKESFTSLTELKNHTATTHNNENFLVDHPLYDLNLKVDITDLSCTICGAKSQNMGTIKVHLTQQHNIVFFDEVKNYVQEFHLPSDDVFQCTSCHSKFETFKMLAQHMNGHYRNFICGVCDAGFVNLARFSNHKSVHSTRSFKCAQCDKTFPTKAKRSNHERTHNGPFGQWVCPHCGLEVSGFNYYLRNKHLMSVHNIATATYKCEICDRNFWIKSHLTSHTKKYHLLEKRHSCSLCEYSCFSKKYLSNHMLTHTGERNHKCEVCQKAYGRKSTLKEHMRIHNNDRRHKCGVCGSAFVQKCSLKSHMQSHHSMTLEENDQINK